MVQSHRQCSGVRVAPPACLPRLAIRPECAAKALDFAHRAVTLSHPSIGPRHAEHGCFFLGGSAGRNPASSSWQAALVAVEKRTSGSAELGFQDAGKVNSLWSNSRLVIALHSPKALPETGLLMCLPEKSQDRHRIRWRAVHSLQSGLATNNRKIRSMFSIFWGMGRWIFSAVQTAWRTGKDSNPWYGFARLSLDISVSCR
jgi:hypothetical protein